MNILFHCRGHNRPRIDDFYRPRVKDPTGKTKSPLTGIPIPPLFAVLLGLTFIGSGCALIIHNGLPSQMEAYEISPDAANYPKVLADKIIVYESEKFAPKGYMLLAKLKSGGDSYCGTEMDLFKEFRKKAAEYGADAVIIVEITTQNPGSIDMGQPGGPNDLSSLNLSMAVTANKYPMSNFKPGTVNFKGYALAIRSKP